MRTRLPDCTLGGRREISVGDGDSNSAWHVSMLPPATATAPAGTQLGGAAAHLTGGARHAHGALDWSRRGVCSVHVGSCRRDVSVAV